MNTSIKKYSHSVSSSYKITVCANGALLRCQNPVKRNGLNISEQTYTELTETKKPNIQKQQYIYLAHCWKNILSVTIYLLSYDLWFNINPLSGRWQI